MGFARPIVILFVVCAGARAFAGEDVLLLPRPEVVQNRPLAEALVEDENGTRFALSSLKAKRKVLILAPFYTRCKSSCSPLTDSLKQALSASGLGPGEYQVVSFSFDPEETDLRLKEFRQRHRLPKEWQTVRADSAGIAGVLESIDYHAMSLAQKEFQHANVVAVFGRDLRLQGFLTNASVAAEEIKTSVRAAEGSSLGQVFPRILLALGFFGFIGSALLTRFAWIRLRRRGSRSKLC